MKTTNSTFRAICCVLPLLISALSAQTPAVSPHQPRSDALTTMASNGSAYYLNRANHTGTQLLATISNAGTLAALSTVASAQITDGTIVSGDIANGTIALGKLAAAAYSTGGNWTADSGKLLQMDSSGGIQVTNTVMVHVTIGTQSVTLQPDSILFQNVGNVSGRFYNLLLPSIDGARAVFLPSASGTIARLEDITPAQLTQSGATTGQGIVWNGSAWAPGTVGGALTIGTTGISGGAGGKLMYEKSDNTLGEISGVTSDGTSLLFSSSATLSWNSDLYVVREAAAVLQLGVDVNGDAVDQTVKAADGVTGTNRNGGDLTMASGDSTGTGTSAVIVKTPAAGSTGTTARTAVERLRIDSTGVWIENTTAPASNPASGAFIIYVDPADNKLKARGSDGSITTVAPDDLVPVALTYGATITPAISGGLYRTVAMTGNVTLNVPSGTPTDGMRWRGRFTADASPRDLTLNAAIKIPSASTFTGTKTIAAGEMWIVQLEYSSALSAWILQSLVGGWQ